MDELDSLWQDVTTCLASPCDSYEAIDDTLREWVSLTSTLPQRFSEPSSYMLRSARLLRKCPLFHEHHQYIRLQLIHSLLQEDENDALLCIAYFLLEDGQSSETTYPLMIAESCFARLLQLLNMYDEGRDPSMYCTMLELMYEMSRMERLRLEDLSLIHDECICRFLEQVEGGLEEYMGPYHYPIIRILLVFNEQYLLASTNCLEGQQVTNRVVKILGLRGSQYRTFGENIILLLNRESEIPEQLLILKLLYLLCTTQATWDYFYVNDLKVLVDIILRNLMDLPAEKLALRHTYLRVLAPLLTFTPLNQPPHYKRDEIRRVLYILGGSGSTHFAPADGTTLRLVDRVSQAPWLYGDDSGVAHSENNENNENSAHSSSSAHSSVNSSAYSSTFSSTHSSTLSTSSVEDSQASPETPCTVVSVTLESGDNDTDRLEGKKQTPSSGGPTATELDGAIMAHALLGMSLSEGRTSQHSFSDIAQASDPTQVKSADSEYRRHDLAGSTGYRSTGHGFVGHSSTAHGSPDLSSASVSVTSTSSRSLSLSSSTLPPPVPPPYSSKKRSVSSTRKIPPEVPRHRHGTPVTEDCDSLAIGHLPGTSSLSSSPLTPSPLAHSGKAASVGATPRHHTPPPPPPPPPPAPSSSHLSRLHSSPSGADGHIDGPGNKQEPIVPVKKIPPQVPPPRRRTAMKTLQ